MEFIIYFLGSLLLGLAAAAWMRRRRVFVVGLVAFLLAWVTHVVLRLFRTLKPAGAAAPSPSRPAGRPPLILPGRLT